MSFAWVNLVKFTARASKYESAMGRTLNWLDDGDSMAFIELPNTGISLLKGQPEFEELRRRNAVEMAQERQHYFDLQSPSAISA